MHGKNPIRPPEKGDGSILQVVNVFPTIQGEGPLAGVPAVFVRLGGCNLACAFCDTEFEDFHPVKREDLLAQIHAAAGKGHRLVVITGGEPLRQNIAPLAEELLAAGFSVQVETNGTLWRPLPKEVTVVCSPKNTGIGYIPIREDVLARCSALKYIVSARQPGYDTVPATQTPVPVYIQPMDEYDARQNRENIDLAVRLAQEHGYRLSLQLHKIAGIP